MIRRALDKLFNEQRFFRRTILIWAMILITHFVLFLMDAELLVAIGAAGATVITGVIGILTSVIGFYQWHRNKEEEDKKDIK